MVEHLSSNKGQAADTCYATRDTAKLDAVQKKPCVKTMCVITPFVRNVQKRQIYIERIWTKGENRDWLQTGTRVL